MDANEWFIDNHAFLDYLGVTVDRQSEGRVRLSLPHDDSLTNPGSETLQGGVVATLADHAGGAAVRTTLDEPLETRHATTDLNVTYLRPATDDLTAEATVLRSGGTISVVRVDLYAGEVTRENLVAAGRVSLYVDRRE